MTKVSTKPYIVRAIYEWCVDQGFTPYIAVAVDARTVVPPGYARDGQIVLNIAPDATNHLVMGNDLITFQARFGGVAHALSVPVANVLAIYARENGHGMAFEAEPAGLGAPDADEEAGAVAESATGEGPDTPPAGGGHPPARGHLKIVK